MWEIDIICSDPECGEVSTLWVEDLGEIDRVVCGGCECTVVALEIAEHRPELPLRIRRSAELGGEAVDRVRVFSAVA
jgi:hypothetical protein